MDNRKLSICMITLNEASAIESVIKEINSHYPEAEIVIVDSSSDGTDRIDLSLGARVIRQYPPRGYGPALEQCLMSASHEIIVTLDCDCTYAIADIEKLLSRMDEGFSLVNGSRLKTRPRAMPLANFLANRTFAILTSLLCGVKTTDVHSGMRAYRRDMLQAIQWNPTEMAWPVELLVLPQQLGYKAAEVFIDYRPRIGESTLDPLKGTVWTLARIWSLKRPKSSRQFQK